MPDKNAGQENKTGEQIEIPIAKVGDYPEIQIPKYITIGDAGADLYAADSVSLSAGGGREAVPTGVAVAIPKGYAGFIQPRSGLAVKHGVTCLNTPGLIDSGYRGELKVLLINTDPSADYKVEIGDRIAQLVIQKVERAEFVEVDELDETERGTGGFGSSGK